jgi:hypothetical protein
VTTDTEKLREELKRDREERLAQHRELIEELRATRERTPTDPDLDIEGAYAEGDRRAADAREAGASRREANRARRDDGGDDGDD